MTQPLDIPFSAPTHRPQFWPKPLNFDRSQFSIIQDFGEHGMQSVTTPFEDTFESIVKDIATGQLEKVVAVHEFNVVELWAKDITAIVAEAVEAFNAKREAA